MGALSLTKKTRFKICIWTNLFLASTAQECIVLQFVKPELDLSTIATTCVAGILTVTTMYVGGNSYRDSK